MSRGTLTVRFVSCQYDVRYRIGYTGSTSRKCAGANAARVRPAHLRGISDTSTHVQIQPVPNHLTAWFDLRHQSGPALERATVERETLTQIEYPVSETGRKGRHQGAMAHNPCWLLLSIVSFVIVFGISPPSICAVASRTCYCECLLLYCNRYASELASECRLSHLKKKTVFGSNKIKMTINQLKPFRLADSTTMIKSLSS